MKIMTKFLMRRFVRGQLLAIAVVNFVVFATMFMQEVQNHPTFVKALDATFMTFLENIPMYLPLAVFLGTLLTFYKLLLSSELVIIQSAGLSAFAIMRPMLVAVAIIGLVASAVINPISTRYNARELSGYRISLIDGAVWVRAKTDFGSFIIRAKNIKNVDEHKLEFQNATVIRQNEKFQITERTDAESMILENGALSAKNARGFGKDGQWKTFDFDYQTGLDSRNIVRQYLKTNQVSFWELPGLIRALDKMGVQTAAHSLQFLSLVFLPIVLMSITALGVMFSQTRQRRQFSLAQQFGLGIITCFMVYFIIQIFNAIGLSGGMQPFFAVFFPPAIVLFFAATVITKQDNM